MKLEVELHPAQAEILNVLLFKPNARFRDLNITKLDNSHFTFHAKRLIELGLMQKSSENTYSLTEIGKEFANRFDTEERVVERQAKVTVLLVPIKKEGDKRIYLAQQRLKQPYFGFFGWATGKIKWGEPVLQAAARELKEETGLEGELKLVGVWHKTDYSQSDNRLLEDKYFFVVRAEQLKGKVIEEFDGGKNFWMTREELMKQEKIFEGVDQAIDIAEAGRFTYVEKDYFYSEEEY